MLIWYVRWLDIEIRYINIECFVKAKHSLMLTFNVDWFQAFSIGWINSGGARYFIVNSLPLDQRYKSGKVVLAASCKETKKLSKHQINHYMEPLVDELVKLYIGVPASLSMLEVELKKEMRMLVSLASVFHFAPNMRRRRKATQRKHQRPYAYHCLWSAVRDRSALLMVACDIPAASKVSGAQVSAPIGIATSAKSSFPAHQSHPLKPDFSGSTEQEPSTSRPHTRKRITHWMPTYGKMPAPLPHISYCICACISNKRRSGPPAVQWTVPGQFSSLPFLGVVSIETTHRLISGTCNHSGAHSRHALNAAASHGTIRAQGIISQLDNIYRIFNWQILDCHTCGNSHPAVIIDANDAKC